MRTCKMTHLSNCFFVSQGGGRKTQEKQIGTKIGTTLHCFADFKTLKGSRFCSNGEVQIFAATRLSQVVYRPYQNHCTHEVTIFELFKGLQLQLSDVFRINLHCSYSFLAFLSRTTRFRKAILGTLDTQTPERASKNPVCRRLKNYQYRTERKKIHQNLAPAVVINCWEFSGIFSENVCQYRFLPVLHHL